MKKYLYNKKSIFFYLFIVVIIFFSTISFGRYSQKLKSIAIVANIAEPIFKVENSENTKELKVDNKNINKEYFFTIKNYEANRISEVDFETFIEINCSNKNFKINYELYNCKLEKEILKGKSKTEKYIIPAGKKCEDTYKLIIYSTSKENILSKTDVDINIYANGKYNFNYRLKAFILSTVPNVLAKTEIDTIPITNDIIPEDLLINEAEISYISKNIDRTPPEIIGIEDGKVYNYEIVNINYLDNVGIKDIIVINKNSNSKNAINPYKLTENGEYQIIVTDYAGNKTEKNIIIKK